jgi:hypothetical protein
MDNEKIIRLFRDGDGPGLGDAAKRRIVNAATFEFSRTRPRHRGFGAALRNKLAEFAAIPMLTATTCATVAALLFGIWTVFHQVTMTDLERQKRVLAEFNEVFGAKLQAVISTDGKTRIVLSESDGPQGQPIAIHLSSQGHNIDIVSFSGENVTFSVAGKQVNIDALVDGKGGVILAGEKLFWHAGRGEMQDVPDLKITAQALEM